MITPTMITPTMITPTQMRAARAMLDVSQGHVAEYLGIAANTLSKIESGQSDVSVSRNHDIKRFYEREGIEFTNNDGVKWASGEVITYKGRSGFLDFMNDVYDTVKNGGDVFVSNVDESKFLQWFGDESDKHIERMFGISDLNFKILVKEGDENIVANSYASYKYLSQESFGDVPIYLYGKKMALVIFTKDDVKIFVIAHDSVAEYFTDRFHHSWDKAKEIY